jgi:hypothetical protein
LFEEAESVVEAAGGGTEFFRTPLGKVRFHWEAEKTRAMNSRMVVVNIDLFGNFNEFSLQQQEQFIQFVSRITEIDPDQVTILEVIDGSIKVTLEMPDESAKQLINFLLEDDPILKNFRILKVELGESVGPPENTQPIIESTPGFLQEITPQVLWQFIFLYFTESQLQDLYFDLGIDYNSLPGDGKRDKAREIVAFCNRHNKFDQLVERSQTKRPKAFFEAFSTGN